MMLIGIGHISLHNSVKKICKVSMLLHNKFSFKLAVYCTSCMIFIKLCALLLSTCVCVLIKLLPNQVVVCLYRVVINYWVHFKIK